MEARDGDLYFTPSSSPMPLAPLCGMGPYESLPIYDSGHSMDGHGVWLFLTHQSAATQGKEFLGWNELEQSEEGNCSGLNDRKRTSQRG